MIPKPPFAQDLSLEEEIRRFQELKPKLLPVWDLLLGNREEPFTSVVVPSLTLEPGELAKLEGASFYEERLLFLLMRLRNPRARVVYLTSQPVHPSILEYYLQMLSGIPASHARARLTLLCAHDASPRSLTEKILERPRLIERIRVNIQNPARAYLTVFNSTPLERRLAVLLGIPLNGLDPDLRELGTKSGSRKIFREAGVECPAGFEDLRTEDDVARALIELRTMRPLMKRAVIKLNDSFSGEGNAIFTYPDSRRPQAARDRLQHLEFTVTEQTADTYFDKFGRMGGIVEEYVEGCEKASPSAQLRTTPCGAVLPVSTHDQILGGFAGQIFLGCTFPAHHAYRDAVREAGAQVGDVLARHGVVSRFGVDFVAWRNSSSEPWQLTALEINLRVGGTTHPFLALKFLTGGELDARTGLFRSLSGREKYYRATDNLKSPAYRGLLPEDLIEILTVNRLHFNYATETGVLFHLIGALSQYGKVGLTAIANSPDQAQELYGSTLAILEAETDYPPRRHGRWNAGSRDDDTRVPGGVGAHEGGETGLRARESAVHRPDSDISGWRLPL